MEYEKALGSSYYLHNDAMYSRPATYGSEGLTITVSAIADSDEKCGGIGPVMRIDGQQ